jgi:hypothetical protein
MIFGQPTIRYGKSTPHTFNHREHAHKWLFLVMFTRLDPKTSFWNVITAYVRDKRFLAQIKPD